MLGLSLFLVFLTIKNIIIIISKTCSAETENDCTACDTSKNYVDTPVSSACPCADGFYKNTVAQECTACHKSWYYSNLLN